MGNWKNEIPRFPKLNPRNRWPENLQNKRCFIEYGDYLFRYALSRLRDANSAEEVVQETFLAAIRNVDQYRGTGAQRGWLLGILKRKIIDFVRLRAKHSRATGYENADPTVQLFDENGNWRSGALPFSDGEMAFEAKELLVVVRSCLKTLPQGQADVFVLSVMEEMDSKDVCSELGISQANLWVRLHRARLGLAKCVGAKWLMEDKVNTHAK